MSEVEITELKPQPTLSIRATIPTAQLPQVQNERFKAISAHLNRHGLTPAGSPFVRYHTFNNTETDMEVGVPVNESASGEGHIMRGELPDGPAISTVHIGAHNRLGEAYARLNQWQEEHGRTASSPGWERYEWIDILAYHSEKWPSPDQWRTTLVQPITMKRGA